MNVFLIDYENVQSSSPLCGINSVTTKDEIHLFYSDSATKISKYYWNKMSHSSCKKFYYKIPHPGKDALDFCIAMQVGKSLGEHKKCNVCIISHDNGYKALVDYCKGRLDIEKQRLIIVSNISEAQEMITKDTDEFYKASEALNAKVVISPMHQELKDKVKNRKEGEKHV